MFKDIWKVCTFYCINHDPPVELYVNEGTISPFYACPRYMLKDENHPNGHEKDEIGCSNRISFDDAMKIIEKMNKIIEDSLSEGEFLDFTNLAFKYKTIQVKILKYTDEDIRIGVKNTRRI